MKTAIVLGATGLTGKTLLLQLLEDDSFKSIKVFSRRKTGLEHFKLQEITCNLLELEKQSQEFYADIVFCCVGTTRKKTPDKNIYQQIDKGIPVMAAKLCKQNNISTFVVISSLGASPNSIFFYNRTKGQMEKKVLEQQISNTFILRPSLILGNRKEKRFLENITSFLLKSLNRFIPKQYQAIAATEIAKTMLLLTKKKITKNSAIYSSYEIKEIAKQK